MDEMTCLDQASGAMQSLFAATDLIERQGEITSRRLELRLQISKLQAELDLLDSEYSLNEIEIEGLIGDSLQ